MILHGTHVTATTVAAIDLAKRAIAFFREDPSKHSFSDEELGPGALIALRWAYDQQAPTTVFSVLVMEIGTTCVLVDG